MLLRVSRGRRVETIWLRSTSEAAKAVVTIAFGLGTQRQGGKIDKKSSDGELVV